MYIKYTIYNNNVYIFVLCIYINILTHDAEIFNLLISIY